MMRRTSGGLFKRESGPRARRFTLRVLSSVALLLCLSAAARALPQTFISAAGNDANTCGRAAPCQSFTGALPKTDAGGEIVALDAGNYGVVTITKSVRITAVGVYAGIESNVTAVNVNAGSSDVVILRGLTLTHTGSATGITGINFTTGGVLHVEDCIVNGWGTGLTHQSPGQLFVKDTIFRGNTGAITFQPTGTNPPAASLDHCRLEKGTVGLYINNNAKVTVRDSIVAGNNSYGFYVTGTKAQLNVLDSEAVHNNVYGIFATSGARVNVSNTLVANGSYGIYASGTGTRVSVESCRVAHNTTTGLWVTTGGRVFVSGSMVLGNGTGMKNDGTSPGVIYTLGNNAVIGNTTDKSGTITPAPLS